MRLFWFSIVLLLAGLQLAPQVQSAGLGVTPPEQFSTLEGFKVELLYEVPSDTEGSWVSLTVDPQGRLIACDQYGGLYRIDVSGDQAKVEKLKIDFDGAQGLLCAFGSLYANVNSRKHGCGIWRLTDTDGDDQYDKKENILPLNGGSEHGPHAMILTPDGKRIITVRRQQHRLAKEHCSQPGAANLGRRSSAGPHARCSRAQCQPDGAGRIHLVDEPRWK